MDENIQKITQEKVATDIVTVNGVDQKVVGENKLVENHNNNMDIEINKDVNGDNIIHEDKNTVIV